MFMPFGKVGSPDEEVGIIQYLERPCAVINVKVLRRGPVRRRAQRLNFDTLAF